MVNAALWQNYRVMYESSLFASRVIASAGSQILQNKLRANPANKILLLEREIQVSQETGDMEARVLNPVAFVE